LPMPRGAKPLYVGEQGEVLHLWALVDPEAPREPWEFCVSGTGHEWPPGFVYLGTVQMAYGLVWHVGHERRKVYR